MKPLRVLSGADVCKILEDNGFQFASQKGSLNENGSNYVKP